MEIFAKILLWLVLVIVLLISIYLLYCSYKAIKRFIDKKRKKKKKGVERNKKD